MKSYLEVWEKEKTNENLRKTSYFNLQVMHNIKSKVCFDVNFEVSAYSWNQEPIVQVFLNNRQTATKLKKNLM